jgi:hypothetical protein
LDSARTLALRAVDQCRVRFRVLLDLARLWPRVTAALAMLASTLLVWAPFWSRLDVLYRHWDGPHYVYLARTLYVVPADHPFVLYDLTPAYYATHLPGYPLLIRALVPLTAGAYLPAMLLATLVSSMAAGALFHEVLVRFRLVRSPLWTAVLFAVLPPRWVVCHSVGASEPLFLCFVFAAFLSYRRDRPWSVMLFTAAASLTRMMGVLLVPAFVLSYLLERRFRHAWIVLVALLATLGLLLWHLWLYGDFLAYFTRNLRQSGHLAYPPLLGFTSYAAAGDFHSVELFFGLYALYGLGTLAVLKHRVVFLYTLALFTFALFVFHFDLSRMFLPLAPFALLVGFDGLLSRRACRWLLPLLVYMDCVYAWGLIPHNTVVPAAYQSLLRVLQ